MRLSLSMESLADQVRLASNPAALRRPAFRIIDALQNQQGIANGEKVLATAVALVAMCESAGLSFDDVLTKARNIMADVEGPFTAHLQAVRDYARDQLRGRI